VKYFYELCNKCEWGKGRGQGENLMCKKYYPDGRCYIPAGCLAVEWELEIEIGYENEWKKLMEDRSVYRAIKVAGCPEGCLVVFEEQES
jgi:hypothetical protein